MGACPSSRTLSSPSTLLCASHLCARGGPTALETLPDLGLRRKRHVLSTARLTETPHRKTEGASRELPSAVCHLTRLAGFWGGTTRGREQQVCWFCANIARGIYDAGGKCTPLKQLLVCEQREHVFITSACAFSQPLRDSSHGSRGLSTCPPSRHLPWTLSLEHQFSCLSRFVSF